MDASISLLIGIFWQFVVHCACVRFCVTNEAHKMHHIALSYAFICNIQWRALEKPLSSIFGASEYDYDTSN